MKTPAHYILPGALILLAAFCAAPAEGQTPQKTLRDETNDALRQAYFSANGQTPHKTLREHVVSKGPVLLEGPPKMFYIEGITAPVPNRTEGAPALTGFDNLTNGFADQGPPFGTIDSSNVIPDRSFNDGRFVFEKVSVNAGGLGPTYNTQSCRECHQNIVTGGSSQIAEHRTGHTDENGMFFESLGGSLIQSRATYADIVEHVVDTDETRSFRLSNNTLGEGYVECVSDSTLLAIRDAQPIDKQGTAPAVPVLEGDGTSGIGRFGWKSQHRSLLSFAADAYLNEMGVTSALFPDENSSNGTFVGYGSAYDPVPDPEDFLDLAGFALFMRSTKAPPRGPITTVVRSGGKKFNQIGCAVCHVASITTATAGTVINGGAFTVPTALGDKIINPYSDFLLHDIGTGDGVPIAPLPEFAETANKMRTAPLWGLRTRNRLMHDGLSSTYLDAITRHAGQAAGVTAMFESLSTTDKNNIYAFLGSL
jgi:CxxC motif-containing protein (DUF1111 family)